MTSFDFDVIGDSPKPQPRPEAQKPPAEQKSAEQKPAEQPATAEPKVEAPEPREKAA
jgi:hypothetical protein